MYWSQLKFLNWVLFQGLYEDFTRMVQANAVSTSQSVPKEFFTSLNVAINIRQSELMPISWLSHQYFQRILAISTVLT